MDDDDEERSRGIPSRTIIGKRGSFIEKFPSLGAPLVLFGGLITIPYWGYRTTPLALMEVMIADLPHVMYHYKEKYTEAQIENRRIVSKDMQQTIKKEGLLGIKGLNLNFQSGVLDGDAILAKLRAEK